MARGELIAWRSLPGSEVAHAGSVRFERVAGGFGTKVKVCLQYDPPGGPLGAAVAKLLGEDPPRQVLENLHRLKRWLEAGGRHGTGCVLLIPHPDGHNPETQPRIRKSLKVSDTMIISQQNPAPAKTHVSRQRAWQ